MTELQALPHDLTNHRVLITGACGGIGQAVATLFARLGATLVLTDHVDLTPGFLETLQQPAQGAHVFVKADLRDRAVIEALVNEHSPLQAAVLNAGVFDIADWNQDDWDEHLEAAIAVNLAAPLHLARALLPGMKAQAYGRIALVGSIAAYTGGTFAHAPLHYAASKGALHTAMRWLARRAAPHVMVNAVAPGAIATRMVAAADPASLAGLPVPRFGRPEEIAWPLAFLCSPGASFVCGATLDVNGGSYMR
ncbi:SDR family oxidoreductase [Pigmentiphaga aceris]|uniref:SDR family oxidoreductase n=1 Tax=Pigmentiphaga aceris TaxID=1940612 RepID=A0A5C0B0X8_9BURK|nr:SDR family NAD(P)-dependent oxidoreductase [Pigmentiphaga aceris]QEI07534.1 SDR family oxidoreductase [Pigmentiphaga aceris]